MREYSSINKYQKINQAVKMDGIYNEFMKHTQDRHWLLNLYNQCSMTVKIPMN